MLEKLETVQDPLSRADLCFSYEQMNIVATFQRLFTRLAITMRSTILSWIFNIPNYDAVSQNLMRIPGEFRNALILFYGPEIADQFNNLMISFISNIFIILEGYNSDDQELVNQGTRKWYNDANELSKFLNSINIFWTKAQWVNLLHQYIQLKFNMIYAFFSGDFEREQQIFNRVFDIMAIIGSFMSQGLIARDLLRAAPAPATRRLNHTAPTPPTPQA